MPESLGSRPLGGVERLLLAGLGLGFVPVLPGTAASLATALVVFASSRAGCGLVVAGVLLVLGAAVTLALAGRASGPGGHGDPGWVVSDEVAGQAIASGVVAALGSGALLALGAFLAFRALDMAKPPPIGWLERFPGGLGVLADDLAAGLGAAGAVVLLQVLRAGA